MKMESGDFFRRDAIAAAGTSLGNPASVRRFSSWFITGLLMILVVGVGIFLVTADFARRETVAGELIPTSGSVRIASVTPGIVSGVHVRDGDQVRAGQKIVTISVDSVVSNGASVADLLAAATSSERTAASLQAAAQLDEARRRLDEISAQHAGLAGEDVRLRSNVDLARERVTLAAETANASRTIFRKGYLSAVSMREREEAVIAAKQALSSIEAQLAANQTQRAQLKVAVAQVGASVRRLKAEADLARAGIAAKEAQLARSRSIVLTAARAGRIAGLTARIGTPVTPDQSLATLLPSGEALVAELWVPSRAIGFVRTGDQVRLMLDSFPFERFGAQQGRITYVSSVPADPRNPSLPADRANESLFRVLATLDAQNVNAYGRDWPLTPGMRLSGDIIFERRSILEWLLDPLRAAEGRSGAL